MAKKISFAEKGIMYTLTVGCDILQFVLDTPMAAEIGIGANRIISIVMGAILAIYFILRGRGKGIGTKTAVMLAGAFIVEEIPLVDMLPFWWMDLRKFYRNWAQATQEQEEMLENNGQRVQNNVRRPNKTPRL